jgi:bidirectional [NiFe] hydrogenase diaphorase subunit
VKGSGETKMIQLTIDQKKIEVPEGRTLLEACRENGIPIPTLCYHPALEPYGGCRLCMVEVAQPPRPPRLAAACVYPCEAGAVVSTNSQVVQQSRRLTAELLLASARNSPEIVQMARELGVKEVRFTLPEESPCVLCGLCVRACREIVGVSAIGVIRRGIAKRVSTPFQIASSRCIGCGTCIIICPTGAFNFNEVSGPGDISPAAVTHRRYFQSGNELDLRPNFVQNVTDLLSSSRDEG